MSTLYGRSYFLEVGDEGEVLRLTSDFGEPARVVFNVAIMADGLQSLAQISVFGLGRESRGKVYEQYNRVKLSAGYLDNTALIFDGRIQNVSIGRDGAETFVTMYCNSTGEEWEQSFVNRTWGGRTSAEQVIRDVAGTFGYNVELIGDFSDLPPLISGYTMQMDSKQAMRNLSKRYGFSWGVRNFQVIVARLDTYTSEVWDISADTGMVGSPQIRERGVDVRVKLNPRINPYDRMRLENATSELTFNNPQAAYYPDTIGVGEYGIRSVTHSGDFYGDAWDTYIEGWLWGGRSSVAVSRTGQ